MIDRRELRTELRQRATRVRTSVVAALCILAACNGSGHHAPSSMLGEAEHGPSIFAPGVISTALPEVAITFTPDGRTLYFGRLSADRASFTIMTSTWSAGRWSEPTVAPFSGQYRDIDAFASPDGSRIYFSSDRPRATTRVRSFSTWYIERTSSGWSEPIDPGAPLNSDSSDVFVSLARDGTMTFSSTRDGRRHVYETREITGRWETPHAIRFGSVDDAGNVLLSPDGRFAVMSMEKTAGRRADLFVSCREGSTWSEPRALSDAVNSSYADFAPALDAAQTTLYFTSERPGIVGALPDSVRPPGDIYRVTLDRAGLHCP